MNCLNEAFIMHFKNVLDNVIKIQQLLGDRN